jgi:hypothetical protein
MLYVWRRVRPCQFGKYPLVADDATILAMKKLWLLFLLMSVLSLNTAGWLASAASSPCHMSQSHMACQMEPTALDGADCLQTCISHYPALPAQAPLLAYTQIKPVFSASPVHFLADPPFESPYKPPAAGVLRSKV